MKELDNTTVESSELVEQTFKFWLTDNQHIRSPFPTYIHSALKSESTEKFYKWASALDPEAKEELTDEAVGEKFEEFIFETAIPLIKTEDERITIMYPFLPRLGDKLNDDDGKESGVVDRAIYKEGDISYLRVSCENSENGDKWKTSFELPNMS
ncbi:MAG: hypothetical protein QNK23_15935 [Crocinitomicaceae bacterium]|nr:hypothetical protein [Crocinitomicaceae bacterium]